MSIGLSDLLYGHDPVPSGIFCLPYIEAYVTYNTVQV